MKKKLIVMFGVFLALATLGTMSLTASAAYNGPYNIVPGNWQDCDTWILAKPSTVGACNADNLGWSYCCNYVMNKVDLCELNDGNNCYSKDHHSGICCYIHEDV